MRNKKNKAELRVGKEPLSWMFKMCKFCSEGRCRTESCLLFLMHKFRGT